MQYRIKKQILLTSLTLILTALVLVLIAIVFPVYKPKATLKIDNWSFILHRNNKLAGYKDNKVLWSFEQEYEKIDHILLSDIDLDGNKELIVLFWRYGDYFAKRDYVKPVVGDENLSQHIFIYQIKPYLNLIWGGSAMHKPIVDLHKCTQEEYKTENYLCATESMYSTYPEKYYNLVIKWTGWGFEIVEKYLS
jgi:hypothetical protein